LVYDSAVDMQRRIGILNKAKNNNNDQNNDDNLQLYIFSIIYTL